VPYFSGSLGFVVETDLVSKTQIGSKKLTDSAFDQTASFQGKSQRAIFLSKINSSTDQMASGSW
jgi:spermidine/putrescine-binding protein